MAILHEIVRVIQSDGVVPEEVDLGGRSYEITYLDDHRQRLEETLRRRDTDRLGMLFGQLTSKVKYQVLKGRSRPKPKAKAAPKPKAKPSPKPKAKPAPKAKAKPAGKHKGKPASPRRTARATKSRPKSSARARTRARK